jgi:homoserine kinase
MQGEVLASGSAHADNVAPALWADSLWFAPTIRWILSGSKAADLFATVIHPQIELKTSEMRSVLQPMVSLKSAIAQWGM